MFETLKGFTALVICLSAGWLEVRDDEEPGHVESDIQSEAESDFIVIPEHAHVTVIEEMSGDWYLSSSAYLSRAGTA